MSKVCHPSEGPPSPECARFLLEGRKVGHDYYGLVFISCTQCRLDRLTNEKRLNQGMHRTMGGRCLVLYDLALLIDTEDLHKI